MKWVVVGLLPFFLVVPLASAESQTDRVVRTCISAEQGFDSAVPSNSTANAIWSRDQLVNYINAQKVSEKNPVKVAAIAVTTMNSQAVKADATKQGCEYLVVVSRDAPFASLQSMGVPESRPNAPEGASAQLAPTIEHLFALCKK